MNNKIKICHLTSVHTRYDTRIFLKECRRLAKAGYTTILIVADGKGNEVFDGVQIVDVGASKGRIDRMLNIRRKIAKKALSLNAEIYHLHDPEMLFSANYFLKRGKKIIYDIHEDLPRQILAKDYLLILLKPIIAYFAEKIENALVRKFTALIVVTPTIKERFHRINKRVTLLRNFPILSLYQQNEYLLDLDEKLNICYIGSISFERGIFQLLDAVKITDCNLLLAGSYSSDSVQKRVENHPAYKNIHYFGYVNQVRMNHILSHSHIGIVTLLPYENHLAAYPVKLFEYMAAGIPVIASDFPLWREFVEGNDCGLTVNPAQPKKIAEAINFLADNPSKMIEMGKNGRKAAGDKYCWEKEEEILLNLYHELSLTVRGDK